MTTSPATYALHLISYIKDDSAVAIHVNIRFDTNVWTPSRIHALRESVSKPPQRFRDIESQRSTYESEWARKAKRGSDKLRDAILAHLATRIR